MVGEELIMFVTNDLSGVTRGRSFPARDLAERKVTGVGWVPANQALSPFSEIAGDNPFGPMGDLRLRPVEGEAEEINLSIDGAAPLRLLLCDIIETDGRPWECCTRLFAKTALRDLEAETGLTLLSSFEQEFTLAGFEGPVPPAFSVQALRVARRFAARLTEALRSAGVRPEYVLPEYGPRQYEVVCRPESGVRAADQAVIIRELVREIARTEGLTASFAPKMQPAGVGNGVHLHFSLRDRSGRPVTAGVGPEEPVSAVAGQFVAGILGHLPALCALTAPSVVSYLRLMPHHWSAAYACFGRQNREAAVRLCPVLRLPGLDVAAQANLEFRAADATASPYMVLGAVVRAGLDGIRRTLPMPSVLNADPDGLEEAERRRLSVTRLPGSLVEALAALEADTVARDWMPETMLRAYLSMKRHEIASCADLAPEALCAKYGQVY